MIVILNKAHSEKSFLSTYVTIFCESGIGYVGGRQKLILGLRKNYSLRNLPIQDN